MDKFKNIYSFIQINNDKPTSLIKTNLYFPKAQKLVGRVALFDFFFAHFWRNRR